ncbi:MAG: DUF4082 domain-containing protein [Thermoanaerobaculia bacterium]
MNRTRTFLAFLAIALTASAALAQTENFRMLQGSGTGWAVTTPLVTCTDTGGFTHWPTHSMTWYLNTSGHGAGKEDAIKRALAIWSYNPGDPSKTDFRLSWGGTRSNGYKQNDGLNMMVWSSALDAACKGTCHAITALLLGPGQVIQEADIQFNDSSATAFQWMTNGEYTDLCWQVVDPTTKLIKPNMKIDTTGIATHELGHSIGIHHPVNFSNTTAVMGDRACTYVSDSVRLKTDDRKALKCAENRYPQTPAYEGAFEQSACTAISGWARNANQLDQTSYVEIVKDDALNGNITILAVTPASNFRSDVGSHGFSHTPGTESARDDLLDGKWHWISTRYSGTQQYFGGTRALACRVQLFPDTMQPSDPPLSTGGLPYEVGTQFSSISPGYITHLGYYFEPGEAATGTHTANLWSESNPNTPLASVVLPTPGCCGGTGWAYGKLSTKVPIQANVRYRVSVNTNAWQAKSSCGSSTSLSTPYSANPPLTAHQGLWRQGSGVYPNTGSCSNFFVSVIFDM